MSALYQMNADGGGGVADNAAPVNLFKGQIFDYGSDLTHPYGYTPMPESYVETPVLFRGQYGPMQMQLPRPESKSGYGLTDQLIAGLPNYVLYGGVAALAYFLAKRR